MDGQFLGFQNSLEDADARQELASDIPINMTV